MKSNDYILYVYLTNLKLNMFKLNRMGSCTRNVPTTYIVFHSAQYKKRQSTHLEEMTRINQS